jgi:hypothetical protein
MFSLSVKVLKGLVYARGFDFHRLLENLFWYHIKILHLTLTSAALEERRYSTYWSMPTWMFMVVQLSKHTIKIETVNSK